MLSQQTNRKIDSDPAPKNTSIAGNENMHNGKELDNSREQQVNRSSQLGGPNIIFVRFLSYARNNPMHLSFEFPHNQQPDPGPVS